MEYVILFGLLIGACFWIINPLLREDARQSDFIPNPEDVLQDLKNKKDGAYAVIRELEFDLSMGKLAEEDFQILKRQYSEEAVGYMIEMDKVESSQTAISTHVDKAIEDDLEQEAVVIRPPESAERKYIFCTSCGERAPVESRFCTACGSNLH
jgi:hypothetical protein